ncbi:LysM peptidoglycan-binding domain-containing protein [Brevibacillus fluminis]|uniref:LysM peptidoglycan-binding domain-containing protein n=1 Tax=Brevibacillus fluminis TaxID=511487 RepID=A0A3M8DUN2_9BACL|nr:stalk domain-containing protein [Brevibacillus fluminis]RNB91806.1 LysM peptidoglycan-binding domain-containing protein [Brevibacillus fluminis]
MSVHVNRRSHKLTGLALGVLLGTSSFFTGMAPAHAAGTTALPTISLLIDGKGVVSDVKPTIQNGRMLVPIRAIAENTGAAVSYEDTTKTVTVTQGTNKILLYIGKAIGYVNEKRVILDATPMISKGRTLIPLRFISQSLGYQVDWDKRAEVAIVNTKKSGRQAVPATVAPSRMYVVQPGDTLGGIAKVHGTDGDVIKKINGVDDTNLNPGQLLTLPKDAKDSTHPVRALLKETPLLAEDYVFPLATNSYEPYGDTYGDGRDWVDGHYEENARNHEGVDIMTQKGNPVYSVCDGYINRLGWNEYGGWRVNITDESGNYRLYYAHMEAYAPGLELGGYVKAGQLLGFVGDTGYGPTGTEGQFDPHLHFGLYYNDTDKSFDPYMYLQYWEKQSDSIPAS